MGDTHSTQSTKSSQPASGSAELSVEPPRHYGVHQCDWMSTEFGMPEPFCTVIAWRSAVELPIVAYFDDEEKCWYSQHDGACIEDVTDWMYYLPPNGAESGSSKPVGITAAADRAAELGRLAKRVDAISAQMNSAIQILEPDQQSEAVLDCLSLADDFVRDLNALAGVPA